MITVGLFILPVTNILNIVFCLLFVVTGTIIALNFNILVACLSFYSPDADGIRNAINHMLRILSGALIPLYLLPVFFKNILFLTPFPAIAFLPVYILQTPLPFNTVLYYFSVTVFWSIVLTIITNRI
jgi:ABC-2 type transport system permease protein